MESRGNFEEVKQKRHLIFVRNKCFILNIQLFVFDLRKKRSVPYFAFDGIALTVAHLLIMHVQCQWFIFRSKDKFTEVRR